MTEAELKRDVLRAAYAAGWLVYHVPATTVRGSQGRGYPDLTLARAGEVIWIELKQDRGMLTEEQENWAYALPREYYVIRPRDLSFIQGRLNRDIRPVDAESVPASVSGHDAATGSGTHASGMASASGQ